ncbi:MAG: hypothetical protein JO340_06375 [Acidobacteriaceae bacterium]|nr:hypothetical protein [Acidobacteriaceae bacterium]
MKQVLLCRECEERFSENGESHVLGLIGSKRKQFSLNERMRLGFARDSDSFSKRFFAPDFGIDVDKFSYFAISVVWRAAVIQWLMEDGTYTQKVSLGDFQEDMRRYLIGETTLPSDMAVIVIVCSDATSRQGFTYPTGFVEANCINFRFLARGIVFRLLIGYGMTGFLKQAACTSTIKPIWYGNCESRTREMFRNLIV